MTERNQVRILVAILIALAVTGVAIPICQLAARSRATAPVSMQASPAPLAAAAQNPSDIIRAATGEEDILWVITDDPALNCAPHGRGGCFHAAYPDTIFISSGLRGATLQYVVLHELAHLHQNRASLPLDECEADAQALAWGADADQAYYIHTQPCTGGAP